MWVRGRYSQGRPNYSPKGRGDGTEGEAWGLAPTFTNGANFENSPPLLASQNILQGPFGAIEKLQYREVS